MLNKLAFKKSIGTGNRNLAEIFDQWHQLTPEFSLNQWKTWLFQDPLFEYLKDKINLLV